MNTNSHLKNLDSAAKMLIKHRAVIDAGISQIGAARSSNPALQKIINKAKKYTPAGGPQSIGKAIIKSEIQRAVAGAKKRVAPGLTKIKDNIKRKIIGLALRHPSLPGKIMRAPILNKLAGQVARKLVAKK